MAIVGRDLEYVEQVLGRPNCGGAALRGAGSGALTGWIFGLFDWIEPLISALVLASYGLIFGAIAGCRDRIHALPLSPRFPLHQRTAAQVLRRRRRR